MMLMGSNRYDLLLLAAVMVSGWATVFISGLMLLIIVHVHFLLSKYYIFIFTTSATFLWISFTN